MKNCSFYHGCCRIALLLLLSVAFAVQGRRISLDAHALRYLFEELAALSQKCKTPAFPPATPIYHIHAKTKRFLLGLHPVVLPSRKYTTWKAHWLMVLKGKYQGKKPTGSWFRQVVTMQRKVGSKVTGKSEYDYYPAAVDVPAIVKAMRKGEPIPMPPIEDPDIQLVRYPTTCSPRDHSTYDLIIAIRSCASCPHHRQRARRTFMKRKLWKGMKVGFFFIMGMPPRHKYRTINFKGLRVKQPAGLPGRWSQAMTTDLLLKEADKYKDILIGNFTDEFYSMPMRTIMGFRWATLYCTMRSPLFLFLDPSYTIVPYQVKKYVKSIPAAAKPNVYAGKLYHRMRISRVPLNKVTRFPYAVSWDELPWVYYPDFLSRVALFLGREQLIDATIAMMFTRQFRFSDVYIGINFYRLRRQAKNLRNLYFYASKGTFRSAMGWFTGTFDRYINWNTGKAK